MKLSSKNIIDFFINIFPKILFFLEVIFFILANSIFAYAVIKGYSEGFGKVEFSNVYINLYFAIILLIFILIGQIFLFYKFAKVVFSKNYSFSKKLLFLILCFIASYAIVSLPSLVCHLDFAITGNIPEIPFV